MEAVLYIIPRVPVELEDLTRSSYGRRTKKKKTQFAPNGLVLASHYSAIDIDNDHYNNDKNNITNIFPSQNRPNLVGFQVEASNFSRIHAEIRSSRGGGCTVSRTLALLSVLLRTGSPIPVSMRSQIQG